MKMFGVAALLFLVLSVLAGIDEGFRSTQSLAYLTIFWVLFSTWHIIEAIEKKEGK